MDNINISQDIDRQFDFTNSPSLKPSLTNKDKVSSSPSSNPGTIPEPKQNSNQKNNSLASSTLNSYSLNTVPNFKSTTSEIHLPSPPPPPPHRTVGQSTSTTGHMSSNNTSHSLKRKTPPPLPQGPAIPSVPSVITTSVPMHNIPQTQHTKVQNVQQQLPPAPPQVPPFPHQQNQHQHSQVVTQVPPQSQSQSQSQHQQIAGRPPSLVKLPPGTQLTVGKHHVTIVKYLSEGGYAHIYVVKTHPMERGTDIACLKRVIVPNKEGLNQLRAEVEVMQRLSKADNIVRYYDSNASRLPNSPGCYEVLVLMELCPNKSLLDFMNTRLRTKLTANEILKIMLDISKAVYNMHKMKLIHRDIKIENVLLDENYNFKLADFGSTCPILRVPRNHQEFQILHNDILMQTTPQYRSPEMIDLYRGLPIDEKSDIWALGVFLYKLCYYTTPFEVAGELSILHAAYSFPAQPHFPSGIRNLINLMLQENPVFRPNIYQILLEVCKLSGFSDELTSQVTEGYPDIYNMGQYVYPPQEQIHPAIEPFTPSIVPFFSPFKAAPRDPLEIQREVTNMMKQQQQQQQQQPISQSPLPSASSTSNFTSDGASNFSTIEDADPFSPRNMKKSTISMDTGKSIPKITLSGINKNKTSETSTKTGISVDSQMSFDSKFTSTSGNTNMRISKDNLSELNLINTYDDLQAGNNSTLDINNTTAIPEGGLSSEDLSIQNVESRFPEINLNNSKMNTSASNMITINNMNNSTSEQSGVSNDLLQVDNLRRSKSMKAEDSKKRFSSNNPFPTLDKVEAEKTGDSIISFEDIKDDLIKFDTAQPALSLHGQQQQSSKSSQDLLNKTQPTKLIYDESSKVDSRNSSSRNVLNISGGYRRLSSEQLAEEIIDFSDEDDST